MSAYTPSDENCLGLYLDKSTLKAVHACLQRGKIEIKAFLETELPNENVNPLYIQEDLGKIQALSHQLLSIAAVPAAECLIRRLKLKLSKQKDIDEAFPFQAEPLLPYPIESAALGKWTVEKRDEETNLAFVSVKGQEVANVVEEYEKLGIEPETISAEPIALAALAHFFSTPSPLKLLIDIEKSTILCVLLKEGKPIASHSIAYGWEDLYGPFSQKISIQDFFAKEPEENEKLTAILQLIEWNCIALLKETKLKENPDLYVLGEGANLKGFSEKISRALNLPLIQFTPSCPVESLNSFSLPLGLALSGLPGFKEKINLRQGEYAFKTPWKRYKQPLFLSFLFSLLLAVSLYFFTSSYTHYREDLLRERFLELLSLTQKTYAEFEKNYEEKNKIETEEGILRIGALNTQEIEMRIDALEKQIRSTPDTFPLFPNTPRVSDLIAWLSRHPAFACEKEGGECLQVNIESLSYTMVKRPEMNKKNEKYQVKVDLEFSTSSPRMAREFHDALISPNDFVDPKGEIKWNATKGKYRTSFFLKDRTFYPGPLKGGL